MKAREWIPFIILIMILAGTVYYYQELPGIVPIHWNAAGVADSWGTKNYLLIVPLIAFILYALMHFLPRIEVYRKNIEKFYGYYYGFKLGIVLVFAFLQLLMLNASQYNNNPDIGISIMIVVSVFLYYAGYMTTKVKRNYFIGIRTPWALDNEEIWDKTNKLGGKLLMAFAIYMLTLAFFPQYFLELFFIPLIAVMVYIYAYSYFEWKKIKKKEPQRITFKSTGSVRKHSGGK